MSAQTNQKMNFFLGFVAALLSSQNSRSFLRASGGLDVTILKQQEKCNSKNKCKSRIRTASYASTFLAVGLFAGNMALAQSDAGKEYNIPPSDMSEALQAFSEQSDAEIIYAEKDVAEKTTKGIEGEYSRERALEEIIGDSGLVYEVSSDGVIIIKTAYLDVKQAGVAQQFRVAQADRTASQPVEMIDASEADDPIQDEDTARDEIIVTGTNIRGIAPDSSPVRTFNREDIQISGAATAQDFIQTLPQNFGGGSNADIVAGVPGDSGSGFNATEGSFGSSVNLRGLGSGSTLVLLNSRRVAPSSGIGDFVDISMIPASAIERVEVMTDGASSIYGADAVAGVVNFVLRDDFDGAEASFRYGTVTEGDLNEYRASLTGGKSWEAGNALIVYEYFNQDNLSVEDRSFSQGAPLPADLLPSQERHSVLASISQELVPDFEVFADVIFSSREAAQDRVSIDGLARRNDRSTQNLNVSAGGSFKVSDTWFADFSGTYSDTHIDVDTFGDVTDLREVDSDIWVVDAKASGTVLPLPGGEIKLAIGGHFRSEGLTNFNVLAGAVDREASRDVFAVFGEAFIPIIGPDNAMPGVQRLEMNVSGRFSDFSDFGSTVNPKVGILWMPIEELRLRGSYSTSFNPPALGRVGATDRFGLVYSTSLINGLFGFTPGDPSIADVVALSLSGTADDLDAEQSRAFTAGFDVSEQWGRHSLTFTTSYFDIKFENRLGATPIPDNRSSFDAPNVAFVSPELFPVGSVIFNPSIAQINQAINSLDFPVSGFPDGLDPLDSVFINRVGIVRNLSLTFVRGIDFGATYTYDSKHGAFSLGFDGTFLRDFQQQAAVTTSIVEQLNTQFNPVDLRMRGRAGYAHNGLAANLFVNYTNDYRVDNTAGAAVIDSWTTIDVSLSYDTEERLGNSALNNMVFRLSVLNLFNEDPPSTPGNPAISIFGYDPTNASPLNRFIAFEMVKRF